MKLEHEMTYRLNVKGPLPYAVPCLGAARAGPCNKVTPFCRRHRFNTGGQCRAGFSCR